jgi:hypothetical protein
MAGRDRQSTDKRTFGGPSKAPRARGTEDHCLSEA